MDIKQLEYFVGVAELGSFTEAAATLRVSQPVLSRHVRQLALELKTHLLYRNGHGVTPTESGERRVAHGKGTRLAERTIDLIKTEFARKAPSGAITKPSPDSRQPAS